MANYYTMVDGLTGGISWQTLDVADAVTTAEQGAVVSATSVGGLWSVTLGQSTGATQPAIWAFNGPAALGAESGTVYFRFTNFTHPASAQDIRVFAGSADQPPPSLVVGGGYDYPAGTTNMRAGNTIDRFGPANWSATVDRATVTEVTGFFRVYSASSTAYGVPVRTKLNVDGLLGGGGDYLVVTIYNGVAVNQTVGFKVEYAALAQSQILG